MKILVKRSLSMLMALVLIVSLFSGVALPASAATYSYNQGYRGVTATSLSSAATNFYAKNNTSYEQLSSYTGSATLSSVPSSALYKQLQALMKNNHSYQTSYNATRSMYQYTDCQGGGGKISSFYSGKEIGPAWDSGSTWNREHTWPNSKGLAGNDENDIMMLRPTATSENGGRGNTAYGISGGYYDPNMESGYTLNLHGDVARIFLYIYVRWGNVNGNGEYATWGSRGVMESREVLLAWMEEDPVDTWELSRNDVVQEITGTRNVFVDYPELAFLMFGEEIPTDMPTPSGMAIAGAHDIQVSSNDTAMGTVSISGRNIQAYPAVGHKVVGYEVVSGTAEVTQNGNTFEVKASSDCEIRIVFAAKPVVELTYLNNGQILSTSQVYGGDPVTLPAYTATPPTSYAFLGWVDAPVAGTQTLPTYYKAGASYTVNGTTSIHALFACTVKDDEGSSIVYTTSTCAHENTVDVAAKEAGCAADGYTDGVYCNDCENYISGHEIIGSLGHDYVTVVTPPTVTDAGYTTHTCDRCGDVYTSDPVPALGETYTVSFSVPVDAAPIEDMGCNTTGILLPEADDVEGHTFLGWVTASVEDTTEMPALLNAGDKYVATGNTTLYALYTYVEGGSAAGGYVLVTSANQLQAGSDVIIASADKSVAMSTTQNGNNRGQAAVTKSGNEVTFDASAGVAVLELQTGAVAGTYAFYCPANGGYLYAASSSGNHLKTKAALDANGSFLLTFDGAGICTATAQGTYSRNTLRYNINNSLFACYSATNANLASISLYVEAPAGTSHYTTNVIHRHSGTYHAAVEATCQSTGNVEYWSCGCGLNFADSGCTQVLSSVVRPSLEHSFTAENADAKYLKTEANCQSSAVYYLSCAGCGIASTSAEDVFVYGSTNPEKHPGEGIFTGETAATCTENGTSGDVVCGACGGVMEAGTVIPATGHADAAAVSETASTCSTHGLKFHFHCDACGGDYLEKGIGAVAQTVEDLQLPLNPQNHEGETELRNESAATCETDGYTGDVHCIACGQKVKDGEIIPRGHSIVDVPAVEPTYEADGNIAHFACETCGKLFEDAKGETVLMPEDVILEKLHSVAVVGGVYFETLDAALAEAGKGETVQLTQDAAAEEVMVRGNVTLDLNGHTLTTDYIFAVNGSHIVDNSEANTGLLVVNPEGVMISKTNSQLPVWNGEGYGFTTVKYRRKLEGYDSDSLRYAFLPIFQEGATTLLKDGAEDNKVTIEVRVSWMTTDVREYRNLVFNETQVQTIVGTEGAFKLTFSGFSKLEMKSGITVEALVVSETGVARISNAYVVDVTQAE